jgi:hypothetical protein
MDIGQRGFNGAIVAPGAERPQEAGRVTRTHAGRSDWFDKRDQNVIGRAAGWLFQQRDVGPIIDRGHGNQGHISTPLGTSHISIDWIVASFAPTDKVTEIALLAGHIHLPPPKVLLVARHTLPISSNPGILRPFPAVTEASWIDPVNVTVERIEPMTEAPDMPLTPGDTLFEYRIVCALGQGAFGTVYLAQDTLLDR